MPIMEIPEVALHTAFVLLTPSADCCAGWPGIPQLTCTCKAAVHARQTAMAELRPELMAALHREWYGDPNRKLCEDSDEDSDDEFSYYDPDAEFSDGDL